MTEQAHAQSQPDESLMYETQENDELTGEAKQVELVGIMEELKAYNEGLHKQCIKCVLQNNDGFNWPIV